MNSDSIKKDSIKSFEELKSSMKMQTLDIIPADSIGQLLKEGDIVICPRGSYTNTGVLFGVISRIKREMHHSYVNEVHVVTPSDKWRVYLKLFEISDNCSKVPTGEVYKLSEIKDPALANQKKFLMSIYGKDAMLPEYRLATDDDYSCNSTVLDFKKVNQTNFNYTGKDSIRWRYNTSIIKIDEGTSSIISNAASVIKKFNQMRLDKIIEANEKIIKTRII